MSRPSHFSPVLLTTLLFLAWQNAMAQPHYDFDARIRFTGIKTFNWLEGSPSGLQLDTFAAEAVRQAVERVLTRRGMEQVEWDGDIGVIYHSGSKSSIETQSSGYAYWPDHWAWGGYYQGAPSYIFPWGTLIIDIVDNKQKQLIWRGSLEGVLSSGSQEKIVGQIRAGVDSILGQFPPPERK